MLTFLFFCSQTVFGIVFFIPAFEQKYLLWSYMDIEDLEDKHVGLKQVGKYVSNFVRYSVL